MNNKEIVEYVLTKNVTQQGLADFLGITRQTVAKILKDEYVRLSPKSSEKLRYLHQKSGLEINQLLQIDEYLDEIKKRIYEGNDQYLDYAYEGIKYMHYWITDEKFVNQEKYHKFLFGHINNFYPRFNQIALFMRDTINRQRYPLVTYQIDYNNKLIKDFCIKAFVSEYDDKLYQTQDIKFPITFVEFFNELSKRIMPSIRFMIYKDYKDDDYKFILDNVKQHNIKESEIYDLSRLFNFFSNEQRYYGPLIENVLSQFRIEYDFDRLLSDCSYRADKIIELINMNSLEDLYRTKYDRSSLLFDSHGLRKDNQYVQKERRKIKEGIK
jgi:transcriptional regulator with XRE-family HTH domain